MDGWSNFFSAELGAAATLTGLLFVSISISLNRVLQVAFLPLRALEALLTLMSVLIIATFGLIPHQPALAAGSEIALVGAAIWTFHIWALVTAQKEGRAHPRLWVRAMLNLLTPPTYIIGGGIIAVGVESGGSWVAAGMLLSIAAAVLSSWVLLIEINR